jgi:hypothetical protein
LKRMSVPSENNQPLLSKRGVKRLGKKFYVLSAVVAVVIIVVALMFPKNVGATVPLNVDYAVGETMIYHQTQTVTFQANNSSTPYAFSAMPPQNETTISTTITAVVIDFDGQYYTFNYTVDTLSSGKSINGVTFSYLEKINKTGYTSHILTGDSTVRLSNSSGNPVVKGFLNKIEVHIGESWTVPLISQALGSVEAELTLTFVGIEEITVPAGIYNVVRVDFLSSNYTKAVTVPQSTFSDNRTVIVPTVNVILSGQMYMEYGTCKQIKSETTMTQYLSLPNQNAISINTAHKELIQHIKPQNQSSIAD